MSRDMKLDRNSKPPGWERRTLEMAYYQISEILMTLDEGSLRKLLQCERRGRRRRNVIRRIHQRYNRVRAARELSELLKGTN